eukprot:CAMPEP_0184265066 /NCGR_PEP_ID=MMETSP0977-20130417/24285_1 /TAXON_ID=483370 /ORGANISM="non described non described, Strain CCMP2097" /LENGTH=70 /DNA_ID=CAMNT_0026570831 /DNA_START=399 /DNA_END=608 /DNA_ORIENTATION=-
MALVPSFSNAFANSSSRPNKKMSPISSPSSRARERRFTEDVQDGTRPASCDWFRDAGMTSEHFRRHVQRR